MSKTKIYLVSAEANGDYEYTVFESPVLTEDALIVEAEHALKNYCYGTMNSMKSAYAKTLEMAAKEVATMYASEKEDDGDFEDHYQIQDFVEELTTEIVNKAKRVDLFDKKEKEVSQTDIISNWLEVHDLDVDWVTSEDGEQESIEDTIKNAKELWGLSEQDASDMVWYCFKYN